MLIHRSKNYNLLLINAYPEAKEDMSQDFITYESTVTATDDDAYPAVQTHVRSIVQEEQYIRFAKRAKAIRLEGHCDERGTREYNLALGEKRAQSVKEFLIVNGISSSKIDVVSYGEERPDRLGSSESAYKANRRVEISLY